MQVVYTSPNRSHHYEYAKAFHRVGMLKAFVCGFSRLSPRAPLPEIGDLMKRHDIVQNLYLGSLKMKCPVGIKQQLAHASKCYLDKRAVPYVGEVDCVQFYNGAGLNCAKEAKRTGTVSICEAVNSHVEVQSQILCEEAQLLGIPYTPEYQPELERRIQEYETADYILVPSEFVFRSFLEKGFPADKMIKNPFGMPKVNYTVSPKEKPNGTVRILYVGQVHYRKGVRYLIEAFKLLDMPTKHLDIVGPVHQDSGVADIDLPEGVVFHGTQKGEDLARFYTDADVFVQPSIEEGLSLVIGEAMAYGLPTIATVNSGASDILEDSESGLLVGIRDPKAICSAIERLLEEAGLYQKISDSALRRVEELGGWLQSGDRLVASIAEVIDRA